MAVKAKEAFESLQTGTPPVQTMYAENKQRDSRVNLSQPERLVSNVAGGALAVLGLKQRGMCGLSLALIGGGLLHRGITGHCYVYDALRVNTAMEKGSRASVKHGEGIKIERSVTINKSPEELYQFWRNFENLPRFMHHLESVQVLDRNLSHWVAKAPAGMTAEWDAQIINEKENELIAWRSLDGATIANAGSVRFTRANQGRGTVVKVEINYGAPGGNVGAAIAKLFGEEPSQQVEEDLRRFKQMMETGEAASTAGQPSGREISGRQTPSNRSFSADVRPSGDEAGHEDGHPGDRILSHGR